MPRYIARVNDSFLEWSTVVDAPVSSTMTVDEVVQQFPKHLKAWTDSQYKSLEAKASRVRRRCRRDF